MLVAVSAQLSLVSPSIEAVSMGAEAPPRRPFLLFLRGSVGRRKRGSSRRSAFRMCYLRRQEVRNPLHPSFAEILDGAGLRVGRAEMVLGSCRAGHRYREHPLAPGLFSYCDLHWWSLLLPGTNQRILKGSSDEKKVMSHWLF